MFNAHLLLILRSFIRSKGYTSINIGGLAIGFAAAILISIYVSQEYTYDQHFKDHEKIYRLSHSSFALGSIAQLDYLENNLAGVEAWVNVMPNPSTTLKIDGRGFIEKNAYYTTQDYLEVFDHPFVFGNSKTALDETNGLIITQSMSKKIFGEGNPIGELIEMSTQVSTDIYQVTGVLEDLPKNSTLKFDVIARLPQSFEEQIKDSFSFTTGYSYFKMGTALDAQSIKDQTDVIFAKRHHALYNSDLDFDTFLEETRAWQPLIQNIADVHLNSNVQFEASDPGNEQYLIIFLSIAVFILVLAAINYVNLATAQASKKAKEVGVRKVLGSFRGQLIGRFLTESVLLAVISVLLGFALAEAALQIMSTAGFASFQVSIVDFPELLGIIFLIALATGIGAGIYPALVLTAFKPVLVLKGNYLSGQGSKFFRNSLVVFQFVISLTLVIFSIFVHQQLNYGLTKELGFNKEGIMIIDNSKFQLGESNENLAAFKNDILKNPAVKAVSGSHYSMIGDLPLSSLVEIGGEEIAYLIQYKYTDANFVPTMGFKLLDGRNFDDQMDSEQSVIIVNETLAKMIGEGIYEKHFNAGNNGQDVQVVGVVEDFHYADLSKVIGPAAFFKNDYVSQLNVRIEGQDLANTLETLKASYAQFTNEPLDYYFFDQSFNKLFDEEKKMSQIINIFTGLSLFVAMLGLIGLISFKLDQRVKEIGVRKVLGASILQILQLFTSEMARLIVISLFVTVPLGYLVTDLWLNGFSYHVPIGVMPFVLVAVAGLALTLLIVCLRSYNAASKNPVNSLRSE